MATMSCPHSPAPSNYSDCVASLRTSVALLESSVNTLGNGVADYPRLSSVLKTVRVSPLLQLSQTYISLPSRHQNVPSKPLRLTPPLNHPQHYELIPQPTLAAAESSLRDEIGPFVTHLLDRADRQIERQARRIETLKARNDLNAGRLGRASQGPAAAPAPEPPAPRRKPSARKTLDGGAGLRARAVRQRKEALKYGVERLEMEVAQKERELRLRLQEA